MPAPQTAETLVPISEVQELVAKAVREAETRLAEVITQASKGGSITDTASMDALAMAIANLADQNTGQQKVHPEELAKRARARSKMVDLIGTTFKKGIQPAYKLRAAVNLGEMKITPVWIDKDHVAQQTEIGWWGEPNEAMDPMNDEAEAIFTLFLESIGKPRTPAAALLLNVTPGGLVVNKGQPHMQVNIPAAEPRGPDPNMPTIRGRQTGRGKKTHILGTIAPPAEQVF